MLKETLEWVCQNLSQALVDSGHPTRVIKGRPVVGRPEAAPPVIGVVLGPIDDHQFPRIGQNPAALDLVYSLCIFGSDEIQKCELVDEVIGWSLRARHVQIDGEEAIINPGVRQPHKPLTTTLTEQFGYIVDVTITRSR